MHSKSFQKFKEAEPIWSIVCVCVCVCVLMPKYRRYCFGGGEDWNLQWKEMKNKNLFWRCG